MFFHPIPCLNCEAKNVIDDQLTQLSLRPTIYLFIAELVCLRRAAAESSLVLHGLVWGRWKKLSFARCTLYSKNTPFVSEIYQ